MPARLDDRFTDLPISRQRKYQLRQEARGCCRLCPEKADTGGLCARHALEHRRLQRRLRREAEQERRRLLRAARRVAAAAPAPRPGEEFI